MAEAVVLTKAHALDICARGRAGLQQSPSREQRVHATLAAKSTQRALEALYTVHTRASGGIFSKFKSVY